MSALLITRSAFQHATRAVLRPTFAEYRSLMTLRDKKVRSPPVKSCSVRRQPIPASTRPMPPLADKAAMAKLSPMTMLDSTSGSPCQSPSEVRATDKIQSSSLRWATQVSICTLIPSRCACLIAPPREACFLSALQMVAGRTGKVDMARKIGRAHV